MSHTDRLPVSGPGLSDLQCTNGTWNICQKSVTCVCELQTNMKWHISLVLRPTCFCSQQNSFFMEVKDKDPYSEKCSYRFLSFQHLHGLCLHRWDLPCMDPIALPTTGKRRRGGEEAVEGKRGERLHPYSTVRKNQNLKQTTGRWLWESVICVCPSEVWYQVRN